MAMLAIKGHPTRGKEVVALLEMLGGKNTHCVGCVKRTCIYFISDNKDIQLLKLSQVDETFIMFTLEEFLEKFPYKVGDEVLYKTYGLYLRIKSMIWNKEKEQVFYRLASKMLFVATVDELKPCKEQETMENKKQTTKQCFDIVNCLIAPSGKIAVVCIQDNNYEDYVEIRLDNYEIKEENGKYYAIKKKSKYPKTYEECCVILPYNENLKVYPPFRQGISEHNIKLFEQLDNLRKLIICRDAYWKIAGKEMRLSKPWEPDWSSATQRKYCIVNIEDNVLKWVQKTTHKVLAFPTEKMRDAFYENFKDLIKQCRELL